MAGDWLQVRKLWEKSSRGVLEISGNRYRVERSGI
jgi:hypothetical protein